MIQTKEEIITKAIEVMHAIDWGFDTSKEINPVLFTKAAEEADARKYMKDEKQLEAYLEELESFKDFWSVGFDFEPEAELQTNAMFLDIWDETGEPFRIRHRQAGFHIVKNENGTYYTEKNWTW